MRYRIYLNNSIFFDTAADLEELALSAASLKLSYGKCGSLTVKVPNTNIHFDDFKKFSYVDVYRDDTLIFAGRVYSVTDSFYNLRTVECEGLMAVFNDSVLRPFTHTGSLAELISKILTSHNNQVESAKQVQVGTIGITDSNAYRKYEAYDSTMNRLDDLVDAYGGYMSIRKTSSGLYLDWALSISTQSVPTIDLGENLLDLKRASDADDFFTVLIPVGASYTDENGEKKNYTIESVNSGKDYLEASASTIATYGRIVKTQAWSDVTIPANLKAKAQTYLNNHSVEQITITVSAVDIGKEYTVTKGTIVGTCVVGECIVGATHTEQVASFIDVGTQVKVNSSIHDIDGLWFNVLNRNLNLLNPASDKITLSATKSTLTQMNRKHSSRQSVNAITNLGTYSDGRFQETLSTINTLSQRVTTAQASIQNNGSAITAIVEEIESEDNGILKRLSSTESKIEQQSDSFAVYFGENGKITSWFTFSDDEFTIQKDGSSIKSVQTSSSHEFRDGNNTLMRLDSNGLSAKQVNVVTQLKISEGSEQSPTDRWAIRKGKQISGVGVNLDIVWIGG